MISLVQMGVLDTSFLVPLQVFQTWMMILLKATWVAEFAPRRLAWDSDNETFVYFSEAVEGLTNA